MKYTMVIQRFLVGLSVLLGSAVAWADSPTVIIIIIT